MRTIRWAINSGAGEMTAADSWFTFSICPSSSSGRQGGGQCCSIKQTAPITQGWDESNVATTPGHPCDGIKLGMNTPEGPSHTIAVQHEGSDNVGINRVHMYIQVTDSSRFDAFYSCFGDVAGTSVLLDNERRELVCNLSLGIWKYFLSCNFHYYLSCNIYHGDNFFYLWNFTKFSVTYLFKEHWVWVRVCWGLKIQFHQWEFPYTCVLKNHKYFCETYSNE